MSTTAELKVYTLKRDDLPPLRFTGTLIDEASTWTHDKFRWTDVRVYRTKGGKYILRIVNVTQWQGESDERMAWSVSNCSEISSLIREAMGHIPDCVSSMLSRLSESQECANPWVEEVA